MTVINLGNLKFTWKGDWAQSTAYNKDDVVKYGPSVWVCVDAHTSTSAFVNNAAKFEVMAEGLENKGVWSQATLYKKGQTVTYGGAVYISLQESTNQNPYEEPAYWAKFVDGQQFEGVYTPATNYQKGDIVYYGGYLYVAKQNTNLNAPTVTTFWDVYVKGTEFKTGWSNISQYVPGDVVSYGGNRYVVREGQIPLGDSQRPTNITYWQLILEGFSVKGNWTEGTDYRPNDIVKFGGNFYRCTSETNSNAPDVNSNFELFLDGFKWKGAYSASQGYGPGDVVRVNGRTYLCTQGYDNDGSTLPEPPNTDYWALFTDGFQWKGP